MRQHDAVAVTPVAPPGENNRAAIRRENRCADGRSQVDSGVAGKEAANDGIHAHWQGDTQGTRSATVGLEAARAGLVAGKGDLTCGVAAGPRPTRKQLLSRPPFDLGVPVAGLLLARA